MFTPAGWPGTKWSLINSLAFLTCYFHESLIGWFFLFAHLQKKKGKEKVSLTLTGYASVARMLKPSALGLPQQCPSWQWQWSDIHFLNHPPLCWSLVWALDMEQVQWEPAMPRDDSRVCCLHPRHHICPLVRHCGNLSASSGVFYQFLNTMAVYIQRLTQTALAATGIFVTHFLFWVFYFDYSIISFFVTFIYI